MLPLILGTPFLWHKYQMVIVCQETLCLISINLVRVRWTLLICSTQTTNKPDFLWWISGQRKLNCNQINGIVVITLLFGNLLNVANGELCRSRGGNKKTIHIGQRKSLIFTPWLSDKRSFYHTFILHSHNRVLRSAWREENNSSQN